MTDLNAIPYVQAAHMTLSGGNPTLIVIHSMECPIENGRASQVAHWFAGSSSPQASAHYMVDPGEVWCGVQPPNIAWHVGSANVYAGQPSIGIEQTGYAYSSDWLGSSEARAQFDRLVDLVGSLCDRWGIPRRWLDVDALRRGEAGISTHGLCTAAGLGTDHTDPGPNWPIAEFMARLNPQPTPRKGKRMYEYAKTKDGRIVLFGIGFGAVAHRWQEKVNGNFTKWVTLGDGQPFGVDNLTANTNADGRFEVMAWNSSTGQVCYRTQNLDGSWRAWRTEL